MIHFGLIGGTSWHSTIEYYAAINRAINALRNDNTNPRLSLVSLNQRELHDLQRADDWDAILKIYHNAALELQSAGAKGIALCANTPHKIYDRLQPLLRIPILHIADAMAAHIRTQGWTNVGLLGTRFTMQESFLRSRLEEKHGITTIVPSESEQQVIQRYFYEQLSFGQFTDEARSSFLEIIERLGEQGCQAVILGCTEYPILLKDATCGVPLIDSTQCHCDAIVQHILHAPV